jgi:hypothetical protein
MALIELVDFNEVYKTDEKEKKKTRRRGGKSNVKIVETTAIEDEVAEKKVKKNIETTADKLSETDAKNEEGIEDGK